MKRRNSINRAYWLTMGKLAFVMIAMAIFLGSANNSYLIFFVTLFVGLILSWFALEWRKRVLINRALAVIQQHAQELKIRRSQLTIRQNYGVIDDSKWIKERLVFIKRIVIPVIGVNVVSGLIINNIIRHIDRITEGFDSIPISNPVSEDPIEYERFVADSLCGLGWNARITKTSGDQGIDIVATKSGVKLVVQCKRYSKPVGNSAVQEIVAGRVFERANFAAVVSNAGFTKSARQLATSTNVFLFHHDQLEDLDAHCIPRDMASMERKSYTR